MGNRRLVVRERNSLQIFQQPVVDNLALPFHAATLLMAFHSTLMVPIGDGFSEVMIKIVQGLAVQIIWRCGLSSPRLDSSERSCINNTWTYTILAAAASTGPQVPI